jgi:hypothetical protein
VLDEAACLLSWKSNPTNSADRLKIYQLTCTGILKLNKSIYLGIKQSCGILLPRKNMNAGSKALHMNSQSINKPILFYMQKQPKY